MPYPHTDKSLVFVSSEEVISHFTKLIDDLIPKLQGITKDDYQAIKTEIAELRQQLSIQLKNFGNNRVDEYFTQALEQAESDQEMYALSNAYEQLLTIDLKRIREALHVLRTT